MNEKWTTQTTVYDGDFNCDFVKTNLLWRYWPIRTFQRREGSKLRLGYGKVVNVRRKMGMKKGILPILLWIRYCKWRTHVDSIQVIHFGLRFLDDTYSKDRTALKAAFQSYLWSTCASLSSFVAVLLSSPTHVIFPKDDTFIRGAIILFSGIECFLILTNNPNRQDENQEKEESKEESSPIPSKCTNLRLTEETTLFFSWTSRGVMNDVFSLSGKGKCGWLFHPAFHLKVTFSKPAGLYLLFICGTALLYNKKNPLAFHNTV